MNQVRMTLRGYGNPDFQQYADIADTVVVTADDPENWEAQFKDDCAWYREFYNMGGGNWGPECGMVFGEDDEGTHYLGHFSYNGRFWPPGSKWEPDKKTILQAKMKIVSGRIKLTLERLKEIIAEEEAKWQAEYGVHA